MRWHQFISVMCIKNVPFTISDDFFSYKNHVKQNKSIVFELLTTLKSCKGQVERSLKNFLYSNKNDFKVI